MTLPGRPTLRCLREDLTHDWDDVALQRALSLGRPPPRRPLHELGHPLIRHVAATHRGNPDDEVARENVAGLTDPMFWKAKSGRWRGAVYEDPETGQAWLCAAGLREEGSRDDFYAEFMAAAQVDSVRFLPSQDDRLRLALELEQQRLNDWKTDIAAGVFDCVATAVDADDATAQLKLPARQGDGSIGTLTITLGHEVAEHRTRESEALVEVSIRVTDFTDADAREVLVPTVCAAISRSEDDWDVVPMQGVPITVAAVPQAVIDDICVSVALPEMNFELPGSVEPTSHSHYVPKRAIARGLVEGVAVVAVCGRCFVPRRDPLALPVCPQCSSHPAVVTAGK